MKISNISINRPVTVIMLTLIVILLGVVSLLNLSVDLYPEINVPVAIVSTSYSGAGPQEIENLVTRPLEGSLATVSGLTDITSQSSEGNSIVILMFDFGIDMESAALEMREKVDMVKTFLPDDATAPRVFKIDPNAMPIMTLSINSKGNIEETQAIVEDKIVSRLERIEGIASVNLSGGLSQEVVVEIDQLALNMYNLSFNQLKSVLISENINLPSGEIERGDKKLPLRIVGEFESIEDISNLPILLSDGSVIRLKDVAKVKLVNEDISNINRLNGEVSIGVNLSKQTDYNTVKVAQLVQEEIAKLEKELDDVDIEVIYDASVFINRSISNVAASGIIGGFLAVLILYLFLRNVRTTTVIAISIPISIIATFSLIYFYGITLNLMTLGGLALGLGMLVDNSIVVLENIYRYRDMGYSRVDAAREGTNEVSMAVVASTLTTVAVFLPIVFVEGVTSILFKELALTVTFSLLASLVVALTLVPMLSSIILKVDHSVDEKKRFSIFDKGFEKVQNFYQRLLKIAIRRRKITIALGVGIFILSLGLLAFIGAEFIPSMDEGSIEISVDLPNSTRFETTLDLVDKMEVDLEQIAEIESIYTSVGTSGMGFIQNISGNTGAITAKLVARSERDKTTFEVADEIREMYKDYAGAQISVSATQNQGFGAMSAPISIELKGDNLDVLKDYSDRIVELAKGIEGTREVSSSLEEEQDELVLAIDREKASFYGVTGASVAQYVRDLTKGTTLTNYKTDGQEISIKVIGDESIRGSIDDLRNLMIETPYGLVSLDELASRLEVVKSPITITRSNQARIVTISMSTFGRDLRSISQDVEDGLKQMVLPDGYSYYVGGQNEDLVESFASLAQALVLAILLVYMIMASQFENIKYPLIIMFTLPLALSGSLIALFITGRLISVPAIIGVIMLAGIVVNNAIVLVDYINTLRSKGKTLKEAVLEASRVRLRPILMTTFTTILGLLPMSLGIGEGAETTAPLATVVIGGLLFSTILTIVFIPTVYLVFNSKKLREEEALEKL
ncbi:MAG: efflux RND transporter permease subunit [Clostridiales bacterium]|nr:efflux RND transporter permease subunit [Clostridiales bacterium]